MDKTWSIFHLGINILISIDWIDIQFLYRSDEISTGLRITFFMTDINDSGLEWTFSYKNVDNWAVGITTYEHLDKIKIRIQVIL